MSVQQPLTASLEDVAAATMTMMKKMMKLSDYLAHTVGWRVASWSSYGPDPTPLDISHFRFHGAIPKWARLEHILANYVGAMPPAYSSPADVFPGN